MWRWRRVAVARVFALVVRYRVKRLVVYSRVGKNRDTMRESPAGAGAGRTADHSAVLFSQKILAVRKANDIYRPVMPTCYSISSSCFSCRSEYFEQSRLTLYPMQFQEPLLSRNLHWKVYMRCWDRIRCMLR